MENLILLIMKMSLFFQYKKACSYIRFLLIFDDFVQRLQNYIDLDSIFMSTMNQSQLADQLFLSFYVVVSKSIFFVAKSFDHFFHLLFEVTDDFEVFQSLELTNDFGLKE